MTRIAKFILLPAKAERRDELLELLNNIRRATKDEPGTQQWILHDVDGQPNSVAMYEVYDDEAASDQHTNTNPQLVHLLPRVGEFLDGEPIVLDKLMVVATLDDD